MARVLVVEDDDVFGALLGSALKNWGHESVLACDGQQGLREVAGHGEDYDLILCDLQMPRMPGKLFLQQVEGLIRTEIPVIVLSADRSLIEALGEVKQWVFDTVEKGCDLALLQGLIEAALTKRREWLSARSDQNLILRLERKNEFLLQQVQEMYEQSRADPMTGLPARRKLEEEFTSLLAQGGRFGGSFVLALCDIDDFRRMNKDWGYKGGDEGIIRCASLMTEAMRAGDLLYRYGGDEFVVLVQAESLQEGAQAAERLRRHVALAPGSVAGEMHLPPITFSAGLAFCTGRRRPSLALLLYEATQALRRAKEQGGNCIWPAFVKEDGEVSDAKEPDAKGSEDEESDTEAA